MLLLFQAAQDSSSQPPETQQSRGKGGCSACSHLTVIVCFCTDGALLSCRWNVTGKSPVWSHSYEGHTDWVMGVALLQDVLITCSRDRSCKAWLRDKGALCRPSL